MYTNIKSNIRMKTSSNKSNVKSENENGLTQFCRQNELNRVREDNCYIQERDYESRRPFKLTTYHHHPYGSKVVSTCYPGQFYKDGYGISGSNVDADSCVKIHPGNIMTKEKLPHTLPTLPVQMPRIGGYFDADIDSNLRWEMTNNFGACINNSEKSYIPYTFYEFQQLCYAPNDPEYIIPEDTFNCTFPNGKFYHFGGEDTRHDRQERYRNGCNGMAKYFPPTLSYSSFGY